MHTLTFYPLSNADSYLTSLENGKHILFDFGAQIDESGKNIDLPEAIKEDIGWPTTDSIDIVAFTHSDLDHVEGATEFFHLEHSSDFQSEDRVKIKTLWVPAAMIVEQNDPDEDPEDKAVKTRRILKAEAKYRLKNKSGIRVFGRPDQLKEWLERQEMKLEEVAALISDAGTVVPDTNIDEDGIEYFVHSPFAEHDGEELKDRNTNSLVMQATIRSGGHDTYFLTAADTDSEVWDKIVSITRAKGNDEKLIWDVQKVAHHCSYKALNKEDKGKSKTKPTDNVQWLLEQGEEKSILILTCLPMPSGETVQPPHFQAYNTYKEVAGSKGGDVVVTMENPSESRPARTRITISQLGATLEKKAVIGAAVITSTKSPRVG